MNKVRIKPMSVNQAWKGRRFRTPKYKKYSRDVLFLLPKLTVGSGKLKVNMEVAYSNRGADLDNFVKLFVDITQKKYGYNDSQIYEMHLYKKIVPKGAEYINFEIIELES